MIVYFAGGEQGELIPLSGLAVPDTTTTGRRTAYTRASCRVTGFGIYNGWLGNFVQPASTFWFSARYYADASNSLGSSTTTLDYQIISFGEGATGRLAIMNASSGWANKSPSDMPVQIVKIDAAGTKTILATAPTAKFPPAVAMVKWDVYVNYAVAGAVRVYMNNVLAVEFVGDTTTNGATGLDHVRLHAAQGFSSNFVYWSEVMVLSDDTRTLTLATLAPAAIGNTFNWTTGSVSDVNETTLNDQTLATSATAGQIFQTTISNSTVPAVCAVVAVVTNARGQKGATGPANAQLMVRTGGADYSSPTYALSNQFFNNFMHTWETNPASGSPWLPADLTAATFNLGIKSVA